VVYVSSVSGRRYFRAIFSGDARGNSRAIRLTYFKVSDLVIATASPLLQLPFFDRCCPRWTNTSPRHGAQHRIPLPIEEVDPNVNFATTCGAFDRRSSSGFGTFYQHGPQAPRSRPRSAPLVVPSLLRSATPGLPQLPKREPRSAPFMTLSPLMSP
jgi:hypothetical protein